MKTDILKKRLKHYRERARLTQEGLATRASVSLSMISQMERGERHPSFETLDDIAKALGVEAGDLLMEPKVVGDRPRYLVQFLEWLDEEKFSYDDVQRLRRVATAIKGGK